MTVTILIVDDSSDDQRLYSRALKDTGYQLTAVLSAKDGIATIIKEAPNLLLLDYQLPDMNGLDFIGELCDKLNFNFPVIMLTGEGSEAVAVEAMKIGVQDYIVKDTAGGFLRLLPSVIERVLNIHAEKIAARELKQLHDRILHSVADGVIGFDEDGVILFSNHSAERMLSCQPGGLNKLNLSEVLLRNGKPLDFKREPLLLGAPEPTDGPRYQLVSNNKTFPISLTASALESTLEGCNGTVIVFQDISARLKIEAELRIAAITFDSYEAIIITDANANIVRVNKAFCDVTGFSADELIGHNPRVMNSGRHNKEFFTEMWQQIKQNDMWAGEIWDRRKNGEVFLKWSTITAIKNTHEEVTNYVAIFNDITETRRKDEYIRHLAFHDALTGLPNRTLIQDRIQHAIKRSQREEKRLSVTFLDLDRFKYVNDSLGHEVGDWVLQEVANRIRSRLREMDTVARLGGDEFLLLIEDLNDNGECASLAQELINEISRPMTFNGHVVEVGASIGMAFYPENGNDYLELMKNADIAMYAAKSAGRNTYRFFQ